jgi:AcrR family transcriptional regulator
MDEVLAFRRARKPEEQQQRREAILAAAAELFDAGGEQAAGLTAIAVKAGFTKSNVYRYFESREEVLLSLFLADMEVFAIDFERAVAATEVDDIDGLARAGADCFIAHRRFATLMSILASVLEHNVSEERIVSVKRSVLGFSLRIASALQSKLPGATLEDCAWAGGTAATIVAGMWPTVIGSAAANKVLAMPEFAHLKPSPERDLPRAIAALLRSIR